MTNKSKNSEQNYDSKLGAASSSFKSCFYIFCFLFLANCFPSLIAGAAISSEQPEPTYLTVPHLTETSQDANAPNAPMISNSRFRRQLWQARISVLKGQKDRRSKDELKRITERVRSIELEPEKKTHEPVIVVGPMLTTEPNETLPVIHTSREPSEKETELGPLCEPVSDQTLQILEEQSQHPDGLENPFGLAEILFLSGNIKEAALFYQQALNLEGADDIWSAQDRAWILFQIGNCLQNDEPPTAKKMYEQLITEHPDSPWTDLAKAQHELIDWYQKDKPQTLVRDLISQKDRKTETLLIGSGVSHE